MCLHVLLVWGFIWRGRREGWNSLKKMYKWRKQLFGDFLKLLNNSILFSLGIVNETVPF